MDTFYDILKIILALASIGGIVLGALTWARKVSNALKCLLRGQITDTYYFYKAEKKIPERQYENVMMLYEGYKSLKGNSFVDKIIEEIKHWEINTEE